jgi:hypothetical protein
MGAAFGERKDVVDFFHRSMLAVFEALLTQWMLRHILGTDTLPHPAVPFPCGWIALVFFIMLGCQLLVCLAVFAEGQLRATGMRAGFLGFVRHKENTSGKIKNPRGWQSAEVCMNLV